MSTTTTTGTLAAGSSKTFTLAPGAAVSLTLSPNPRVTITETPELRQKIDAAKSTAIPFAPGTPEAVVAGWITTL